MTGEFCDQLRQHGYPGDPDSTLLRPPDPGLAGAMSVTDTILVGRYRRLRWTGTLAVVGGFMGITGSALVSVGYFGVGELRSSWLDSLPWIAVVIFGFLVRFLSGPRSAGASLGLAVIVAAFAGPAFIGGAARLRWIDDPGVWPTPAGDSGLTQNVSDRLLAGGLALILIACVLVAISAWIPVARTTTISGERIPRSPYRVEVLTLIFAMVVIALATSSTVWSTFGTYSNATQAALVLSWLVPLSVVLALTLRSSGLGSLWAAGALAIVVIAEPALRTLGLLILEGLNWTQGQGWWYQEESFATSRALIPTLASPWLLAPGIALIVVIVLWNTQPPAKDGLYSRNVPATAPLDPWSGAAFVLSFVPLLSIPALFLGHTAYERIVGSDRPLRGRIFAATAIAVGILNLVVLGLVASGASSSVSDIWIGG